MEQYFDQLRNFALMRKRESDELALNTTIALLLDTESPLQVRIPEILLTGYHSKGPALLYTGSHGVKAICPATGQHLSDFMSLCGFAQRAEFRTPFCVAKQESAYLLMDTLAVSSLWHKCIAQAKKLILQKFILSQGDRQLLAHATWKSGLVSYLLFANKHPHCDQGTVIKLFSTISMDQRFLTAPIEGERIAKAPNLSQIDSMLQEIALRLKHHFRKGSFSEVVEFAAEFVLDIEGNWVLIRILYYDLNRKAQTISGKKLHRQMTRSNPGSRGASTASSSKRPSQRRPPTSFSSLVFPVSLLELKQISKQFRPHRQRTRSSFLMPNLRSSVKTAHHSPSILSRTITAEEHEEEHTYESLLPIFQFPTPRRGREPDDEGLMNCTVEERVGIIKKHIARQNNSLYMRIHYQNELPEHRMMKELYKGALDKAVSEMERLRVNAKAARESLAILKANKA
jgi:hypothetical protein